MADIVDRLKFDAARCEVDYSKGVAGNIEEAATEIERLRARLDMIAGIAEGSTTANSLPHIAKIARGLDEQKHDKQGG